MTTACASARFFPCSLLLLALVGCATPALRPSSLPAYRIPYPYSRAIIGIRWDFSTLASHRTALGSDLWPCTWAVDGELYCAWGDGGGFDGNDDHIGRASLGIARVSGDPDASRARSVTGKNVSGVLPYAEAPATFGGKVGSLIALDGLLYATGRIWTAENHPDPVQAGGPGPLEALLRSSDLGRTWSIIATSNALAHGSFLNFGRDGAGAIDSYVYFYYVREGDNRHFFLKRIRMDRLESPTIAADDVEYLARISQHSERLTWSLRESDAISVFVDVHGLSPPSVVYDAPLRRFLMTCGHGLSDADSSPGKVGLFESPHPWGPWATVGYYDDWGQLGAVTTGDFLGLHILSKWISATGEEFWAVFSGLGAYDSFNIVRATLETGREHRK
jgi:hypothetical protein